MATLRRLVSWCLVPMLCAACSSARRVAPVQLVADPAALAADPLTSPYFPPHYTAALFTDYAAMRECGVLAMLERMPMVESWNDANAHLFGYDADDVDRVFTVFSYDASDPGVRSYKVDLISVADTAPEKAPQQPDPNWTSVEVGGHRGFRAPHQMQQQQDTTLWPRPGLAVQGPHAVLQALCSDGRPAGGPHPDLRQLLAGERVLFQYAFGRFGRDIHKMCGSVGFLFPFYEDDPVDFARLRVALDADGGLVVSLRFQYGRGTTGLQATEDWVRTGLRRLSEQQDTAALRPLLLAVAVQSDSRNLDLSLPLGPPRQAMQKLERAVLAWMSRQGR